MEHIRYVMKCMQENTTKIRSIKQYMPVSYTHLDVYKRQLFDESQQVLADVTGNKRLSGVQVISR